MEIVKDMYLNEWERLDYKDSLSKRYFVYIVHRKSYLSLNEKIALSLSYFLGKHNHIYPHFFVIPLHDEKEKTASDNQIKLKEIHWIKVIVFSNINTPRRKVIVGVIY